MLMRIASLEEMILASCMGHGILGDITHWEVDMFYFVSDGVQGVKVWKEVNCIMEVRGRFKVDKKFI